MNHEAILQSKVLELATSLNLWARSQGLLKSGELITLQMNIRPTTPSEPLPELWPDANQSGIVEFVTKHGYQGKTIRFTNSLEATDWEQIQTIVDFREGERLILGHLYGRGNVLTPFEYFEKVFQDHHLEPGTIERMMTSINRRFTQRKLPYRVRGLEAQRTPCTFLARVPGRKYALFRMQSLETT